MASSPPRRLSKIKSSAFSRGLALARVSVSAGTRAASHAVGNLFAPEDQKESRMKELVLSQVKLLTRELGELKGSLMKVGQLLSMYGEHFLPPEANALLKSLQSQSPPLEWSAIEKVLQKQLGAERLAELEIDPEPIASASLGQVHRAKRKSDGQWLALKIQYPGVDQAIEGDLKALRSLLSVSKLIPKSPKYDQLFREVRAMLHQEVDYERELKLTEEFREILGNDPRYVIPRVAKEYSTKRVLTTSLEMGIPIDSHEVLALSQERRNAIGLTMVELYFKEIFIFGAVQTDPHFGNYRIRLGQGGEPDRIILFDFGAVRKFQKTFLDAYREVATGAFEHDQARIEQGGIALGFLREEDSPELRGLFAETCHLFIEPFLLPGMEGVPPEFFDQNGAYDWGSSDLAKRAARKGAQFAFAFKLRPPPREVVFLDRKIGGVFVFLSVLKVRVRARELLAQYLYKR